MNNGTESIVLIVGGVESTGVEVARRVARSGSKQIHFLRSSRAPLEQVARDLPREADLVTHKIDFCNDGSCSRLVAWIDALDVHVEALITISPDSTGKRFVDLDRSDVRTALSADECRCFLIQAVARNMSRHGGGVIANVCQMPAMDPMLAGRAICAAGSLVSAGLYCMTPQLAAELQPGNIAVHAVAFEAVASGRSAATGSAAIDETVAIAVEGLLDSASSRDTGSMLRAVGERGGVRVQSDPWTDLKAIG